MKKTPLYRVVRNSVYENCELKVDYYTIEVQRPFLFFWKSWYPITDNCPYSPITLRFKTEAEAIFAIKNLETGIPASGEVKTVTTILDFNKNR